MSEPLSLRIARWASNARSRMSAYTTSDAPLNVGQWDGIDLQRSRTKGWWENMYTLRIRQADNVLEDPDFTVFELSVREGIIQGVRLLQRGAHAHTVRNGPFLWWGQEETVQWFMHEERPQEGILMYKQLWAKTHWVGHQAGLAKILEAFT